MIELGQKAQVNSFDILARPLPRGARLADRVSTVFGRIRSAAEKVTGAQYTREATERLARITEGLEGFSPQLTGMNFSLMQDGWVLKTPTLTVYRDPQAVEVKVKTPFDGDTVVEDSLILVKGEKPMVVSHVPGSGERNAQTVPLIKSDQARNLYEEVRAIVSGLPDIVKEAVNESSFQSATSLEEAGALCSILPSEIAQSLPAQKRELLASRCSWVLGVDESTQVGRVYTAPERGEVLIQTPPYPGTDMAPTYFFGPDGLVYGFSSAQDPSNAAAYRVFPTPRTVEQDAQYAATLVLQSLGKADNTFQSKHLSYTKGRKALRTTYGEFLRSTLGEFVDKRDVTPKIEIDQRNPHQMALHVNSINGAVDADVQLDPSHSTTRLTLRDPQTAGKKGAHFVIISPQGILFNGLKLSEAIPAKSARIAADIVAVRQQVVRLLQGFQDFTPQNGFASSAHLEAFRATVNNTLAYLLSCFGKNGTFILPQRPYKLALAASSQPPERAPRHGTLTSPRRPIGQPQQVSGERPSQPSHPSGASTHTDMTPVTASLSSKVPVFGELPRVSRDMTPVPVAFAIANPIKPGSLQAGSLVDPETLPEWMRETSSTKEPEHAPSGDEAPTQDSGGQTAHEGAALEERVTSSDSEPHGKMEAARETHPLEELHGLQTPGTETTPLPTEATSTQIAKSAGEIEADDVMAAPKTRPLDAITKRRPRGTITRVSRRGGKSPRSSHRSKNQ